MAGVVFILGAGASFTAGGPLMQNFFDKAEDLQLAGKLQIEQHDYERVMRVRKELQRVFFKAHLSVDNLEGIYCALEMARVIGKLGDIMGDEELAQARNSLENLIVATLEGSIEYPIGKRMDSATVFAPKDYRRFAMLVRTLTEEKKLPVGIITFNYDIALDFALETAGVRHTYCLDPDSEPRGVALCKLHGSLNWTTPTEEHPEVVAVSPHQLDFRSSLAIWGDDDNWKSMTVRLHNLLEKAAKGDSLRKRPFIVPPTDSKLIYRDRIRQVWRSAARLLENASTIVVSGFSLPPTDEFFRSLYAIGSIGSQYIQRFWVIDPNDETAARLSGLLAGPAKDRYRHFRDGFGEGVFIVGREFNIRDQELKRLDPDSE